MGNVKQGVSSGESPDFKRKVATTQPGGLEQGAGMAIADMTSVPQAGEEQAAPLAKPIPGKKPMPAPRSGAAAPRLAPQTGGPTPPPPPAAGGVQIAPPQPIARPGQAPAQPPMPPPPAPQGAPAPMPPPPAPQGAPAPEAPAPQEEGQPPEQQADNLKKLLKTLLLVRQNKNSGMNDKAPA